MKENTVFIEAGKIFGTHGVKGGVKLQPWADSPEFLKSFKTIYIDDKPVKVLSAGVHKGCVNATLEGVTDIDAAIKLKGKVFKIKKSDVVLEEGKFFIADLIGLDAINYETDEKLGMVNDVLTLPSHNVYVIKGEREILVPAVSEFIMETNLEDGFVKIRMIEGL